MCVPDNDLGQIQIFNFCIFPQEKDWKDQQNTENKKTNLETLPLVQKSAKFNALWHQLKDSCKKVAFTF